VDVISKDSKTGLPVRDFKKDDFEVLDNGQEIPITTFSAGAHNDTRPITFWIVVICNEGGLPEQFGHSAEFAAEASAFRPALNHLENQDTVGVAHWCDNGEAKLDLEPTKDIDRFVPELTQTLKPIPFQGGTSESDAVGAQTFRKMVRLIIRDAARRNPQPLPVVVFLHGDYTGQSREDLDQLIDDFLETSGIVFGISDKRAPKLHLLSEQARILHYMTENTGGEYFSVPPSNYAVALEAILAQLHFRYELGFIPPTIDGKRHQLKLELTKEAKKRHKGVRLKYRPEYIPTREDPEWVN
jgi:hypothetical protein